MKEQLELINDMEAALVDLEQCGKELSHYAIEAVNTRAHYEKKKNMMLLEIAAQEGKQPTVDVKTAMYRNKYAQERLAWQLADAQASTQRELHRGLLAKINALQSLLKISEGEYKIGSLKGA